MISSTRFSAIGIFTTTKKLPKKVINELTQAGYQKVFTASGTKFFEYALEGEAPPPDIDVTVADRLSLDPNAGDIEIIHSEDLIWYKP